jgi:DNA-binding SARP family transcriptional activator
MEAGEDRSRTAPPDLRLRLLGGFSLAFEGELVTAVDAPRLQSLLAHLVLEPGIRHPRERLASLFWPESEASQSRTNLRQALHHLRRALPESDRFLEAEARVVRWRADAPVWLDVAEFETLVARAGEAREAGETNDEREALEGAVALYAGDLVPDCYDDWIVPERQRLRESFLGAAERLTELLELERDYRSAVPWARRVLDEDPLNEQSCRRLMRLYALCGDRAAALRVYHGYATSLAREAGVEPGAEIREAYEQLLEPDSAPPPRKTRTPTAGAPALVGRSKEWETLLAAWRRAAEGESLLAVVVGEPGIGKSRLAEELRDWVSHQGTPVAGTRCYSAAGALAYAPIVDLLRDQAIGSRLRRLGDAWLVELARLLPELLDERPDLAPPPPLTDDWQRTRLLDAVSHAVLAEDRPLLLAIDDLQWCDGETLAWVHYVLRSRPRAPLLVVATARSEELGPEHPAQSLLHAARASGHAVELELEPLSHAEVAALARNVSGRELNERRQALVYRETEGNPLFVVELARAGLVEGAELPPRAHSVIEARLAQLSPAGQELASLAATVGRAFTFKVLALASSRSEEDVVEALDELWKRRIVRERGVAAYDFSHDKLRDAAYARAGSARRGMLHGRVAQALERLHATALDPVSSELAVHYERAGWTERAIGFYARSGEVEQRVFANERAIDLFTRALVLLDAEPATRERDERELQLRTALVGPLVAIRGYGASEVHDVCMRALELCERLGRRPNAPVLRALALVDIARGDLSRAYQLGEQLLELGAREDEPMVRVEGNYVLGVTSFWLGEFAASRDQLERAIADYAPDEAPAHIALYSQDPQIVCLSRLAYTLRYLGETDRAEETARDALRLAEELEHPFSLAYAVNFAAWLAIDLGDASSARERIERMAILAEEKRLGFLQPMGVVLRGWMLASDGQAGAGVAQIREGIDEYTRSGWSLYQPYALGLLARACLGAGRIEEARAALRDALELSERIGQRCLDAELHTLMAEAEAHFSPAVEVARRQAAAPLAERASEGLERLRAAAG